MPERIQRRRTKGWTMPQNTVYVGRPTRWGNPFSPFSRVMLPASELGIVNQSQAIQIQLGGVEDCLAWYRIWALRQFMLWENLCQRGESPAGWLDPLWDKNLACWCPLDCWCHVDVLLQLMRDKAAFRPAG